MARSPPAPVGFSTPNGAEPRDFSLGAAIGVVIPALSRVGTAARAAGGELVPIKVFISYAHEDAGHLITLEKHLSVLQRDGLIETYHRRRIEPGASWRTALEAGLNQAALILLLVSVDFLASNACYSGDMARALAMRDSGRVTVLPILVRTCDYARTPIGQLKCLPECQLPIDNAGWGSADRAWSNVAASIRAIVEEKLGRTLSRRSPGMTPPPWDGTPPPARPPAWSSQAYVVDAQAVSARPQPTASAPSHAAPPRRSPLVWITGVLALLFATIAAASLFALAAPSDDERPRREPAAAPTMHAPAGPVRACCGGEDCGAADKRVTGSLCASVAGQCSRCPSNRSYVAGACATPLASEQTFHLRLARIEPALASLGASEICVRRSGAPASAERCVPVAGQSPRGNGSFGSLTVPVADLVRGGRGLDIELRSPGYPLARRVAAVAEGREIGSSALCLGLYLRVESAGIMLYLDD